MLVSCCLFHPSWLHLGSANLCSRLHFLLILSLSCLTDQHIFLSWTVSVILLFLQPFYHQLPIAPAPGTAAYLQCSVGVCQERWNKTQLCNSYSQPSWFNASCRCVVCIASLPLGKWVVLERGREKRGLCLCMCVIVSHMYACVCIYTYIHVCVCVHVFVISAWCPLRLVRHASWQVVQCV